MAITNEELTSIAKSLCTTHSIPALEIASYHDCMSKAIDIFEKAGGMSLANFKVLLNTTVLEHCRANGITVEQMTAASIALTKSATTVQMLRTAD